MDSMSAKEVLHQSGFKPQLIAAGMEGFVFDIGNNLLAKVWILNISCVGVVHGDLCPENVLVDEATVTPISLLDFGFLTTSADPFFDAVISTLIFDMYSPRRQKARESLWNIYSQKLGQPFRDMYPLYKATYALVTSNAYSEDGDDGHFRWCVDILNDEETNRILS